MSKLFSLKNLVMVLVFFSFITGLSSFAASKTTNGNTSHSKYVIQNFHDGALDIQFRYINGILMSVRFLNSAAFPLEVKILEQTYILGPNDSMVIDPPHVKYLRIEQKPYYVDSFFSFDGACPHRFQTSNLYILPKRSNNKTLQ